MLTRLKVNGFKNLVDVDVRFGPFTCIAGANGVGKSNLFDAIRFLSALSRVTLLEAAQEVRGGRTADVRELFHRVGDTYDDKMSFEVEMIVPKYGEDNLGQQAQASSTFLHYSLTLGYRSQDHGLEIHHEELVHIKRSEAPKNIHFDYSKDWFESAVVGRRTAAFISTQPNPQGGNLIMLHADRGESSAGRPAPRQAHTLPRTLLQAANAAEYRTSVLAQQEMQSWRLLQLEPSALREPDNFNAPSRLSEQGAHLPAMLYRLAQRNEQRVYETAANRLSELIAEVREIGIDRDEKRELLTLWAKGEDGTPHAARSLSEGTLRFLALAVLEQDPASPGVLCLEEPENGIHPVRIAAMIRLLKDIAVDTKYPLGEDNPLRQVIVNTHSPAVVRQVDDADLVAADAQEVVREGKRFKGVVFRALPDTWRAWGVAERDLLPLSRLMASLDLFQTPTDAESPTLPASKKPHGNGKEPRQPRRVIDRPDVRQLTIEYSTNHSI